MVGRPSSSSMVMLAVRMSIDWARLHGFLEPLTMYPSLTFSVVIVGLRIGLPGLPSAKPEAISRWSRATASSISHSKPVLFSPSATIAAMLK